LVRVQERMLAAASRVVRPGGLLVYSTCTLEPEENEQQVARFLDRHEDFAIEASEAGERVDEMGCLRVEPHRGPGSDGAFAARMRKTA
jgi:16S rRNA (cytosine967-C5)-methyltransferase